MAVVVVADSACRCEAQARSLQLVKRMRADTRQAHWADTCWQAGWASVHLHSAARVGDVGDNGRRRGGLY